MRSPYFYKEDKDKLTDLNEEQFNQLKAMGMLWEIFPGAPEFYTEIERGDKE